MNDATAPPPPRPRRSSLSRLPADIRELIDKLLAEGVETRKNILAILNRELDRKGDKPISKSALNRYAQRMEEIGLKMAQAREVARVWIEHLESEPPGDLGKLLNEVVRTLAFDFATRAAEGDEPVDHQVLRSLAATIERLEQASRIREDRDRLLRREITEQAANQAKATARRAGISQKTISEIERDILGLA
ncbi:MAG: DUF3486 family protein [Magnetococcales bacterium]|nr:DUF3486 family protein [Magnetococcales bacterium]